MRMVDLIEKKKLGQALTKEEINYFVEGYTKGEIEDYQVSALAMAIYFQKMNEEEATNLAMAMLHSGDELDLSTIEGIKVDKHSTGGVGDKTSLVLGPLVAAVGAKVAKMSGRGLGHTGGTIDKLEAIKGYNVAISNKEFFDIVNKCGLSLIGQTGNLCPADKKLYALRDVTATVDIIPLIASSIMSKKLASGSDCIVLDVKVGSGAFMKTIEEATELAELMVKIGRNCGRKMTAVLTDMDEPLGCTVGNALEVIEAIETLQNKGPHDLTELCIETGAFLVVDAGVTDTLDKAKELLREAMRNGSALEKFKQMVELQGGDVSYINDITKFDKAKNVLEVKSDKEGYVQYINALDVGIASMKLGGGRESMKDVIDMGVGVVLNKKIGDKVSKGEVLAYIHANDKNIEEATKLVFNSYNISNEKVEKKIILKTIR